MQKNYPMKGAGSKKKQGIPDNGKEVEKELKELILRKKTESDALKKILNAIEKKLNQS